MADHQSRLRLLSTKPDLQAARIVADARTIFEHYLDATPDPPFGRQQRLDSGFLYPEATIQSDTGVFLGVFTCLWRAFVEDDGRKSVQGVNTVFNYYYTQKTEAFAELLRIVTPNKPDPNGFTAQARLWGSDRDGNLYPLSARDAKGMWQLCRTLRNGFCHFNFRYADLSPTNYFRKLTLDLPGCIPERDLANNYRMFICDWSKRKTGCKFMDPGSDTRIIETHFAHLRYHLFKFLALFFAEPNHSYVDILTHKPIP